MISPEVQGEQQTRPQAVNTPAHTKDTTGFSDIPADAVTIALARRPVRICSRGAPQTPTNAKHSRLQYLISAYQDGKAVEEFTFLVFSSTDILIKTPSRISLRLGRRDEFPMGRKD